MSAASDFTEVAERVLRVQHAARSLPWQTYDTVARDLTRAAKDLAAQQALIGNTNALTGAPSDLWQERLDHCLVIDPSDAESAAGSEADATAAVAVAAVAIGRAEVALLRAAIAAEASRDDLATLAPASPTHKLGRSAAALVHRVADEMRHVAADNPRSVINKVAITLGIALAYIIFFRLIELDEKYENSEYLAFYIFSAVVGSAVCTNALSLDARRARAQLTSGEQLWRILVAKNLSVLVTVAIAGAVVLAVIAYRNDGTQFVKASAQLLTMVLIWLGLGNVLSVIYPLRVEPLTERLRDGTWKPFLISLAISYVVGLTVNLMLYWRVLAKETALEKVDGPWLPATLVVASGLITWLLLTVLAATTAQQSWVRKVLLREMIPFDKTESKVAVPDHS